MLLCLARHGQTEWQVSPNADLDTRLTALGHEQSSLFAGWLRHDPVLDAKNALTITSLCASPALRAQQTAGYISAALELPLVTLDALSEATFHVAETLPMPSGMQAPGEAGSLSMAYVDFKLQAAEAIEMISSFGLASDAAVLAIAHGGLIKTLLRVIVGCDAVDFRIYNASVSILEWSNGRWNVLVTNLMDHLPQRLRTF